MGKKIATLVAVLKEVALLYDSMFRPVFFMRIRNATRVADLTKKECDSGRSRHIKLKVILY